MVKLKQRGIVLDRLEKFISEEYFTDFSLATKIYPQQQEVDGKNIYVYSVPNLERAPPKSIIQNQSLFTETLDQRSGGKTFGPSWSTHWFQLNLQIPESFEGKKVVLLWDSDSEAMIFDVNGVPLQGLTGGDWQNRHQFIISTEAKGGSKLVLYVEMACNGLFGVGNNGFINPPDPDRTFNLKKCKLAVLDQEAYDFYMDYKVIAEMAKQLPEDSNRGNQAIQCASEIINNCNTQDKSTWPKARKIAQDFLQQTNGSSQHQIIAVGHCHIDVAWLWPYAETRRKSARSWASQCEYMDRNPDFTFAQSQAQLYDWVKTDYPELFDRIKEKVKKGQFIPVGGTWVEMDGILPTGEAMIRQFVYGQRFFKQEFGSYVDLFWLPDSFGYSGQLPQIMKSAKIEAFVTQKLSWNLWNKFPNSTMNWEGLDGSSIIAHFPPADTYCGSLTVEELLHTVKNAKGKDKMNCSLALYGHGDGGGGPVPEMIHRVKVCNDVDGLPKIKYGTPHQFFDYCKKVNETKRLETWRGELYLEMHRGCYTSQASTKKGNRKGEILLRDIEVLSVLARLHASGKYPTDELERLWKLLLLNQFHDVLPGSSIGMVYKDAVEYYEEIQKVGSKLREDAIESLQNETKDGHVAVYNTLGWGRSEVVELPHGVNGVQKSSTGNDLAIVSAPALGYKVIDLKQQPQTNVTIEETESIVVLQNDFIKVTIQKDTGYLEVFDLRANRVAVQDANKFLLFEDIPLFWDAWDVEFYYKDKPYPVGKPSKWRVVENGPIRVAVEVEIPLTADSTLTQQISLTSLSPRLDFNTQVKWHESHKFLKVAFPTTIRSPNATYEVQFGHLQRPTHSNTSWEKAQFEVHAQKWADLSEYNYGVSILNDCKYGYSAEGNVITLSLLRAPKAPDADCDMGDHQFVYSILPHVGAVQSSGVIQEGYNLNAPLQIRTSLPATQELSLFTVDQPNIIIESVKKAEDSNDVIVRFYEAFGGFTPSVTITSHAQIRSAYKCNVLEENINSVEHSAHEIRCGSVKAFEIVTLKLSL